MRATGAPPSAAFPLVSIVQPFPAGRMSSVRRHWLRWAAAALSALAACSRIGDGADDSPDAAVRRLADAAPGPDAAASPDAGPVLVDTLAVPTDGTAITTGAAAASGTTYRLEASGTFKWGNCDSGACPGGGACGYDRLGDAYYRTDDCWSSTTPNFAYISLYVDGAQVDWGPYDPGHVYSIELAGTGAPLSFRVMDCDSCYLDNSGQLVVEVYRLPVD